MKKIFYDGYIYTAYPKQSGGVSRYFDNLISRLPHDFFPALTTGREKNGSHPDHQNLRLYRLDFHFRPRRLANWVKRKYFDYLLNDYKPQIFHPTYYSLLTGRQIKDYPYITVLTVYDMIDEIFADSVDPNGKTRELKRRAIFSADALLCISESTKNDLLERYPSLEDRVSVTYLATEFSLDCIDDQAPIPEFPYLLYVGARGGYKNFDKLLLAFSQVTSKSNYSKLLLCVVGSPFSDEERKQIEYLNLSNNITYYGRATDGQLAKLYNSSIALVYPSLYEGFGIPPLEAMACNTAVISSNVSSLPEVIGNAGLLFDPTSIDDLTDQILFLMNNPLQREALIDAGKKQLTKFDWDKTVKKTVDTYLYLLNRSD